MQLSSLPLKTAENLPGTEQGKVETSRPCSATLQELITDQSGAVVRSNFLPEQAEFVLEAGANRPSCKEIFLPAFTVDGKMGVRVRDLMNGENTSQNGPILNDLGTNFQTQGMVAIVSALSPSMDGDLVTAQVTAHTISAHERICLKIVPARMLPEPKYFNSIAANHLAHPSDGVGLSIGRNKVLADGSHSLGQIRRHGMYLSMPVHDLNLAMAARVVEMKAGISREQSQVDPKALLIIQALQMSKNGVVGETDYYAFAPKVALDSVNFDD